MLKKLGYILGKLIVVAIYLIAILMVILGIKGVIMLIGFLFTWRW